MQVAEVLSELVPRTDPGKLVVEQRNDVLEDFSGGQISRNCLIAISNYRHEWVLHGTS